MYLAPFEFPININNTEVIATVEVDYSPYVKGKVVGLPEDCYPDIHPSVEIISLKVKDDIDITYLLYELPSLRDDLEQDIYTHLRNVHSYE